MKEFEFDKVIKRLTQLKEQPFNEIIRIGSMLSLGFGDKIKSKAAYKTNDGAFEIKETQNSKYALHIDGLFRISLNDKILLTRDDMFKPSIAIQDGKFDEETFEWDVKGNNKLDAEIMNIFDFAKQTLIVKDMQVNKFGDLSITLSNGCNIDVFIDTNEDEECWRFFEVGNSEKPHIIITGYGYCEEC